jgi:hypothetical protein
VRLAISRPGTALSKTTVPSLLPSSRDRLAQADAFRTNAAELAEKLGAILGDWVNITRKPVPQQRQLRRKLLPDRLTVTPHVDATNPCFSHDHAYAYSIS